MADDPIKRLENHGREPTPPIDKMFADRLESHLRVEHAAQAKTPRRRLLPVVLPRIGVAAVVAVAVVLGAVALSGRDAGVPVAVVDDQTPVADEPMSPAVGDEDGDAPAAISPTSTPTPTPTVEPTPPVAPTGDALDAAPDPTGATSTTAPGITTVEPLAGDAQPAQPTATVNQTRPDPSPTVARPTPTPTLTNQTPEPIPSPTALAPTPRPIPTATPAPRPTQTVAPTPTVIPGPIAIDLVCRVRAVENSTGVICEWDTAETDRVLVQFEVWRSRNDGEPAVVSRQRATAPPSHVDRAVDFGDTLAYLVRGLDADGHVIAASVREVVVVPGQD